MYTSCYQRRCVMNIISSGLLDLPAFQECPPKMRKRACNSKHHRLSMCVNTPCRNIHGLRFSSDGHLKNSTFKIQVQLVISICACISGRNASRCKTVGEKIAWESRHKNLGTQQKPLPISVSGIGRLRPYPACRTYRTAENLPIMGGAFMGLALTRTKKK